MRYTFFKFTGHHLGFFTSGFFPFGRRTTIIATIPVGFRKQKYKCWNREGIKFTFLVWAKFVFDYFRLVDAALMGITQLNRL